LLVKENLIDFDTACKIFDMGFRRVKDISASVRKAALSLLGELLSTIFTATIHMPKVTEMDRDLKELHEMVQELDKLIQEKKSEKQLEENKVSKSHRNHSTGKKNPSEGKSQHGNLMDEEISENKINANISLDSDPDCSEEDYGDED
jgi:hypothetical protein